MNIKPVEMSDRTFWMSIDTHVSEEGFQGRVFTKAGYVDCGGLVFQGTPNSQPMEMFMRKVVG